MDKLKSINNTMFKENKYKTWYYNIINAALLRVKPHITEKHHIIPKSLGGTNDDNNLVHLTPREHYICHACLTKFTSGGYLTKMTYAFWCMSNKFNKQQGSRSKLYEYARTKFIKTKSASMTGTKNHFHGRTHSTESKQKMSDNNGMHRPEVREKASGPRPGFLPHNHFTGWSDEVKSKISKTLTGHKPSGETIEKMKRAKANLVWVYKDRTKPRQINATDLESLLNSGWVRGRGPRKYW